MSQLSEDDLIARVFAPVAGPGGLGLRDDAALVSPRSGRELVVTVDALVAGVHFFPDDPPASIARKALGVNLSDLAAKGADPLGFVLTLALPADWTTGWLEAFAQGLGASATASGCALLGGDTVKTPGPLMLSVTAFGEVPQGAMVRRTGARPGDRLFVSGTIGDAALGLGKRMSQRQQNYEIAPGSLDIDSLYLIDRYLHPQPRLGLIEALRRHASGAMDVSDGLVGDVTKMLAVSGVTGWIDLPRVPLSDAVRSVVDQSPGLLTTAVTGGDDYEILAAVPANQAVAFGEAATRDGIAVTEIGAVEAGGGAPVFHDAEGEPVRFDRGSFSHF